MLQGVGAVLILAGCSGMGFWYRKRLYLGLEHLRLMRQILELFISEIAYGEAALPECCLRVGERVEEPYRGALLRVCEAMEKRESGFRECFRENMAKALEKLPVNEREKESFLGLGDCCGLEENRMQIRAIEQYRDRLETAIGQREAGMEKQGKLAAGLGILCGLFLVIVLY